MPLFTIVNFVRIYHLAIRRGLSIREYRTVAVIRSLLTCLTPRQIVSICPSTRDTSQQWMAGKVQTSSIALEPFGTVLQEPSLTGEISQLHWIKPAHIKTRKVILFFHGGGYNAPLTNGHLDWCFHIVEALSKRQIFVAVAVLEYGLTPENRYPTQLRQARNGLQQLFDYGFHSNNIVIGGDSAGGNLALGLLSHLMHKHPHISSLSTTKPLGGAFLVSPWLTDNTSSHSFRENATIDMLSTDLVKRSAKDFLPESVRLQELKDAQGWALPSYADVYWWDGLGDVVANLYVTTDEQELFRDYIINFADLLRNRSPCLPKHKPDIQLEIGFGEAHDHILTLELMKSKENPALERLIAWMTPLLRSP